MTPTHALLLKRQGLVFVEPESAGSSNSAVRAVEIKLSGLGFALSSRLAARLERLSLPELTAWQEWACSTLAAELGADQKHEPLFRRFPEDIPSDTTELWFRKVLSHFLQAEGQPCLFCRRTGTTHVLNPCQHVVCDQCFDGSNYSACPVCERHVDRSSPFFKPTASQEQALPRERVTFKLLDLGGKVDVESRALFVSFCERKQAMSPGDVDAFKVILGEYREQCLDWLPATIPVKENVAHVFGTLFQSCAPMAVLPVAKKYLATATDVLRLIAAYSGANPALQAEQMFKPIKRIDDSRRWWGQVAVALGAPPPVPGYDTVYATIKVKRFKVAKLGRPLRKALLEILEQLPPDRLTEDMLRHQSYWVWVGEFLHPHEYAERFPNVARAFAIVRKKAPDGTPAPPFQGYYGKLDTAVRSRDAAAMIDLLQERPGELARRFDHALRIAASDGYATNRLVETFTGLVPSFSTPVLLTLRSMLPTRTEPAKVRIYWPKGGTVSGVSSPDKRPTLPPRAIPPAVRALEAELLRRFAAKPAFESAIIDTSLRSIIVPFNERTASRSAVMLPRGSSLPIPEGKMVRLFLHWCEPEKGGEETDIDLSIGFYDANWQYLGVCSYYQLKFTNLSGEEIAVSSGDRRNAPYPDGAAEFVDLHRERAREYGIRYAVMVVNNYAGMPFGLLERAFAGLMFRDNVQGPHFDPRTVEHKFAMQGNNGVFLPLVLDLAEERLHWVDAYSRGEFAYNNVENSNAAITRICPEMIEYFGSGVRHSMYELALLHAAARTQRVYLRGETTTLVERQPGEDAISFFARLKHGDGTPANLPSGDGAPVFAALTRGDLPLPPGSTCYALFRDGVTTPIAASDLIA